MGSATPPSILIVQNDPDLRALMVDAMRDIDAEVASASTGRLATVMIAARRYDLALIDAILPDMSGIALAGLAADEDIPAILVCNDIPTIHQLAVHGLPYLQKPLDPSRLRRACRRAIGQAGVITLKVKASVAVLETQLAALRFDLAESHRIMAELVSRLERRNAPQRGGVG